MIITTNTEGQLVVSSPPSPSHIYDTNYGWITPHEREILDDMWAHRNAWRIYRRVYAEERANPEWIDIGGESG